MERVVHLATRASEGSKSGNRVARGERKLPASTEPQDALAVCAG